MRHHHESQGNAMRLKCGSPSRIREEQSSVLWHAPPCTGCEALQPPPPREPGRWAAAEPRTRLSYDDQAHARIGCTTECLAPRMAANLPTSSVPSLRALRRTGGRQGASGFALTSGLSQARLTW
jgi:hypothetical protein